MTRGSLPRGSPSPRSSCIRAHSGHQLDRARPEGDVGDGGTSHAVHPEKSRRILVDVPRDDIPERRVDESIVEATPRTLWALLENGDRLTDWAFMVKHTTGGRESLGAARRCDVEFDGRPGKVAERCAEFVPGERIAWVMTEDSFGFSRMFADMGFSFTLEALDDRHTRIQNESFYRPLNLMARLMSVLIMRRKFRALRRRVLANLKALAERRGDGF